MEKNLLIKKYLEQNSLVESNLLSFNDFLQNKMQSILNEINESIDNEEVEVKLGKIRFERPSIVEADGSKRNILPVEARLRGLSYSAPIHIFCPA